MTINEAIAQAIINFSTEYPLIAGTLLILFVMRPVNKIGTMLFHRKVEKRPNVLNNKIATIIQSKWYFRLFAWVIDTLFSIKIISDKQKVVQEIKNGKYSSKNII